MVLRDLDRYVVKPTGASGGYGVVIGPKATYRELVETRDRIEREPKRLHRAAGGAALRPPDLARRRARTATGPSRRGTSTCVPSSCSARSRACSPGGLTRVALREGSLIVNSSQGGGSKDTWVLER